MGYKNSYKKIPEYNIDENDVITRIVQLNSFTTNVSTKS